MSAATDRCNMIASALRRCAADLDGEPLNSVTYAAWRTGLRHPFSVPTALAIAGTSAQFAAVCAELGIEAAATTPADADAPPATLADPSGLGEWSQQQLIDSLRSCAADIGMTPSETLYSEWLSDQQQPDEWPAVGDIAASNWHRQLFLARLRIKSPRRTDSEIWAHVALIRERFGAPATRSAYDRYRATHAELRLVSASTLVQRTGKTWSELFGSAPSRQP